MKGEKRKETKRGKRKGEKISNFLRKTNGEIKIIRKIKKRSSQRKVPVFLNEWFLSRICSFGIQLVMMLSTYL